MWTRVNEMPGFNTDLGLSADLISDLPPKERTMTTVEQTNTRSAS